jgi:DNA-binding CsgD family transcriptional regulator
MKEKCMSTTMLGEKAYRLKHIAYNLDRHIETIRRHVRNGKLKAYIAGGEYYVIESDLNKYLRGE